MSPNDPSDTTTLTATPSASGDPLSKPVTFVYQWLENGTPISGRDFEDVECVADEAAVAGDQFSVGSDGRRRDARRQPIHQRPRDGSEHQPRDRRGAVDPIRDRRAQQHHEYDEADGHAHGDRPLRSVNCTYAYQWLDNGTDISGATSSTLTLPSSVAADDKIAVQVTPSDSIISGAAFTSGAVVIGSTNPFTIAVPTVQSVTIAPDNAADATTLTATPVSTDSNGATVTYTYQWLENGNAISG